MARLSNENYVRIAAESQGYEMNHVALREGEDFSSKPVQLILTERLDDGVRREILSGIEQMKFVDIDWKIINLKPGKSALSLSEFTVFLLIY